MSETPAIVLYRGAPLGKQVPLRLLCQDKGVVPVRAFGLQKSRRRFPSGLSVTMWGQALLYQARGCVLVERFDASAQHIGLGQSPTAFAAAAYLCELSDQLLVPGAQDSRCYPALLCALSALARDEFAGGWLRYIEIAWLSLQGWMAIPGECSVCGRKDAQDVHVDSGRWHCPKHPHGGSVPCSPELVHCLRAMMDAWTQSGSAPPLLVKGEYSKQAPALRRGMRNYCWAMLRTRLQGPLKSRRVMMELAQSGG